MGNDLIEERSEQRRQVILDILGQVDYVKRRIEKNKNNVFEETAHLHMRKFIEQGILHYSWTWSDISEILTMIKWKMEEIGQKDEFLKIFNEFEYKKPNYSNWYIEDVITLLTRLVVEHTDILQAIIADYLESLDRQVIENGKIGTTQRTQ